jgi:hypothetical protein
LWPEPDVFKGGRSGKPTTQLKPETAHPATQDS